MKISKIYFTLFLTFLFLTLSHLSKSQCHLDDWGALKALYQSLDGADWWNQGGWNQVTTASPPASCNLSNLYGVELDSNGRVAKLDLNTNYLRGYIAPEIGNLTNLTYLNFYYNLLEGPIPAQIGNLVNLTYLNLGAFTGSNDLGGSIPSTIGNLVNLQELNLRGNDLLGQIPVELSNLVSLIKLDLSYNNLTGNILPELGNLQNLENLSLSYNNFDGEIPNEFSSLTELIRLDLSENQLSGIIPPSLGNLNNLYSLNLQLNNLTGNIPVELSNLTNLKFLLIGNNQLSGCYDNALLNLFYRLFYACPYLNCGDPKPGIDYTESYRNSNISAGNNFEAAWHDFGTCNSGACEEQVTLNLDGTHDAFSRYFANDAIYSTAELNYTTQYVAENRIRLNSGFKTNTPHSFNASISASCQ